jgi:diacylglycerol kinase (ATP)
VGAPLAPGRAPLEAITLAAHAVGRYEKVIAAGGDGTVHEVVNGLMRGAAEAPDVAFGVLPLGSGDDFAKMLPPGVPVGAKAPGWEESVRRVARGRMQRFDVGRLSGKGLRDGLGDGPHYFANGMDVGFGAVGALNAARIRWPLTGMATYLAALAKTMIDYPTLTLRLQLDGGEPFEQASTMTAVMNGRCFGSGFWVCPEASPDDGVLDLMVTERVSRLQILRLVPKIMRGAHGGDPALKLLRARRVVIESREPLVVEADGELPFEAARRVEVEVLPRRLAVIA